MKMAGNRKSLKPQELSGVEKAAIFFITLGPDKSAKVMKLLPEKMIEQITYEISNITKVDPIMRDAVLTEFIDMNESLDTFKEGGLDYAREVLTKALGTKKAQDIIETSSQMALTRKPFILARRTDSTQLLKTIISEHPQTIALVLCFLQQEKSASILSSLPDDLQTDVAYRIATMSKTSPIVIKQVEKIMNEKLSNVVDNNFEAYGGIDTLVGILNSVNRPTEKNILQNLDDKNHDLAEEVKLNMFVFEDIITLDDTSIQRVLREIDNNDLILALKGASEVVASAIFANLSKRASETLKEDLEFLGPVRLTVVEEAQHKVVGAIRRLEEAGEIYLNRGGEDAVIV
jgi:flagellar motor switch protein FliG